MNTEVPTKTTDTQIVYIVGTSVYIYYVDVCRSHWGRVYMIHKSPHNSYTRVYDTHKSPHNSCTLRASIHKKVRTIRTHKFLIILHLFYKHTVISAEAQ